MHTGNQLKPQNYDINTTNSFCTKTSEDLKTAWFETSGQCCENTPQQNLPESTFLLKQSFILTELQGCQYTH